MFSVQMEWQFDERIGDIKWTVETHTTQLDGIRLKLGGRDGERWTN
jgi:hypothetical protein